VKEILVMLAEEAPATQIKILTSTLKLLMCMHDILYITVHQAPLAIADNSSATESIRMELQNMQFELHSFGRAPKAEEVLSLLLEKRELLHCKFVVCMYQLVEQFRRSKDKYQLAFTLENTMQHHLLPGARSRDLCSTFTGAPNRIFLSHGELKEEFFKLRNYNSGLLFVGCETPENYSGLLACLHLLNKPETNYASAQYIYLDLLLEDLLAENKVMDPSAQPTIALSLQLDFLKDSMEIYQLKNYLVSLKFRSDIKQISPQQWQEIEKFFLDDIVLKCEQKLSDIDAPLVVKAIAEQASQSTVNSKGW
jgi:hypothetical protein